MPEEEKQERLLAGKYKDKEALERGYLEQARETSRVIAYTRKLEQENERIAGLLNTLQAGNAAEGEDIPPGLEKWLEQKVQTLTAGQVEQLLTPVVRSVEAASELGAEDSTFMRGDPTLMETFHELSSVKPEAAAQLVKLSRELDEFKRQATQATQDSREAEEARAAALASAGIGDTRRGDSRQAPVEENTDEEAAKYDKLKEHAQEYGDSMPLLRERLFGGKKPIVEMWAPGEPPPPSMLPELMKPQE